MQELIHVESKHFAAHQLAEGVYAAIAVDGGSAISNSGIIDLGGQVVIFDTFLTLQAARDLRSFVEESFGRPPQIIINSHYHNDHIWGNQIFLPEAQVISSSKTRTLITTEGAEEYQFYTANSTKRFESFQSQFNATDDEQQKQQFLMWLGYYGGLVETLPFLNVTLPGITFTDKLELHGSKRKAELITFEDAHTGSDTILYLPQEGIVFMSDLLFVGCHPYLAEGNPQQLLKALQEVSQTGAKCFVPGHGPVGTIGDLHLLIDYTEHCLDTAQALVNEGHCDEERVKALLVPEKYKNWSLPMFYQTNILSLCQRQY
jgi:glyoxylase-like metal-dependent hydrolase (beta-lactamase superfamily II)